MLFPNNVRPRGWSVIIKRLLPSVKSEPKQSPPQIELLSTAVTNINLPLQDFGQACTEILILDSGKRTLDGVNPFLCNLFRAFSYLGRSVKTR